MSELPRPAPPRANRTGAARSGGWGKTRISRDTERRIYFLFTMAMGAYWLAGKLWGS